MRIPTKKEYAIFQKWYRETLELLEDEAELKKEYERQYPLTDMQKQFLAAASPSFPDTLLKFKQFFIDHAESLKKKLDLYRERYPDLQTKK